MKRKPLEDRMPDLAADLRALKGALNEIVSDRCLEWAPRLELRAAD